tara:strand:+ start:562 stop:717 length:156 start_codon:yes stop_codon:yes gene_type:complete
MRLMDVLAGWTCPECGSYLEQDDGCLYCLQCGWDEEEKKQEESLGWIDKDE